MRNVALNALWNVSGQVVSLIIGLLALPLLLRELGAERLGVFTLALGLIGFSGLFDLGLGRALTQTVATALAEGRRSEVVSALVTRVLQLLGGFGLIWMLLLWLGAPWVARTAFSLHGDLAAETTFGLRALALSIPVALIAAGAVGAMEGMQQFRLLSLWRMPMSVIQFGLPVAAAFMRPDIGWVIAALALTRLLWMIVWLLQLRRLLPGGGAVADTSDLRHAFHFGGWLSVSNIIGPIMVYLDRFYLAAQFPPATVAYYTVPLDASFRATSLPQTAINALFPAFAQARSRPELSGSMLGLACQALIAIALPPALLVAVFAEPLLTFWLGKAFTLGALPIFRLLILGMFCNSLAHPPYALIQANGRPDLTAKLHLLELPAFMLALGLAVHFFGITGAAIAWSLRVLVDGLLLYFVATRMQPKLKLVLPRIVTSTLLAIICLCLGVFCRIDWILWLNGLAACVGCAVLLQKLVRSLNALGANQGGDL